MPRRRRCAIGRWQRFRSGIARSRPAFPAPTARKSGNSSPPSDASRIGFGEGPGTCSGPICRPGALCCPLTSPLTCLNGRRSVRLDAMHQMRLLEPAEGVLAFYDGRVDGYRFADGANWVDDGALSLGIASYAIVCDDQAMVYDTHVSVEHARYVRTSLEARGVRKFTVVLSHWHLDHVAGTAVFGECEIIASRRTAELLARFKGAIEAGTHEGPPAINPLLLPTTTFDGRR